MNKQLISPNKWNLLVLPHEKIKVVLVAITRLAMYRPLTVLDCGRQFDSSIVARTAHGRQEIIDRIKIQRAFTCYEVVKLLEQKNIEDNPVFILDFLSTFQDENVKIHTRRFLFESCIRHFQRIKLREELVVTISNIPISGDSFSMYKSLMLSTPNVFVQRMPAPQPDQLNLL